MSYSLDVEPDEIDLCSEAGARILAVKIRDYWVSRGFRGIKTGIKRLNIEREQKRGGVFGVVTNLGPDGYPPRL